MAISAATAPVYAGYGGKDRFGIQAQLFAFDLQLVRQNIEQHFRIGIGVDVAQVVHEQLFLQLGSVGQVAVVAEHDAERRVHVERLRLVVVHRGTGRRITHMRDARVALQCTHVAGAKHIAHQTVVLVQMESMPVQRGDAGSILPAMLQDLQAVIQQLIGRYL